MTLPRIASGRSTTLVRASLAAPGQLVLARFFRLPLGYVLSEAIAGGGRGFIALFGSREFWAGLRNSLLLGLLSASLSLGVGVVVALRLARMAAGRRLAWQFLIALPLTFSGLIVAY